MSLSEYSPGYTSLWATMTLTPNRAASVSAIARRLYSNKARYLRVSEATGVPWFIVAAIHEREASGDFSTQLGQGDPLDRVSTHVPKGMGPYLGPNAWENAAIAALRYDRLDKVKVWNEDSCCFELEAYNGFGPRRRGINSGYLWSFTNHYSVGKYKADGVWDASEVDGQCGTIPIVRALMQMDQATWPDAAPDLPPAIPPVVKHTSAAGAGAAAGGSAAAAGMSWGWIIAIAVIVGLVAWLLIHFSTKRTP